MSEKQNDINEGSILIPRISVVELTHHHGKEAVRKTSKSKKSWLKYLAIFGLALALILLIFGIASFNIYKKALLVKNSVMNVEAAVKSQDLEKIKTEIAHTKSTLSDFKNSYKILSLVRYMPFAGSYYSDGNHVINAADYSIDAGNIFISAIEPYADIIGFSSKSKASQSGEQTAQERIDFIVKTIPDLVPKADSLNEKISLIKKEVDQIDPDRYPEKFRGKEIRSKIKEAVYLIDQGSGLLKNVKPLLEEAPYLLGVDSQRKYLVLFQNDKELRPTGGFLTAYSIGKVEKGRFEPVLSSDIYNLDSSYKPRIKADDPLVKYLKGPYLLSPNLRLRDMNWSPSFAESMKLFTTEAKKAGIDNIDGVISVDTQVLVNLLNVTGPVGVPGFGTFSTNITPECKCPQVIFELESFADVEGPVVWSQNEPGKIIYAPPNYDNRKKIIGPLMNSVLANVLAQPKEKFPVLFDALIRSLTEKHILLYLFDEKAQSAVSQFGIGGTLNEYNGDYLLINDANLGGRKSNLYVTQEVTQEIQVGKDGSVTKTVTITYKNPEKQDGWLNSILPNWVRVYVPKGSSLISFDGVEDKASPYEELGKTVFAGFFQLRPLGVSKVTLKYKLPGKVNKEYKLFVQKQPGKDTSLYTIKIGRKSDEILLKTDKEFIYKI